MEAPDASSGTGSPTDPYRVVIRASRGWPLLQLGAVWEYRELLYFLVWRDVKVRYKQTALGMFWVVLQPLVSIAMFTFLFGVLLQVPSGEAPYPVFALAALLPWNYFASSLMRSSVSVVGSANLITKVYFPRLVIPLAGVLSGLVDLAISFIILLGLMAFYRLTPTAAVVWLPLMILLAMVTALSFGLWLSALNVRFRDVNHLMPFLIQVWMYATPVVYGASLIPEPFRIVMGLNPMTGVVEGFRWALLGGQAGHTGLSGTLIVVSSGISLLVLVGGVYFFRATERSFADII
ncbi:MAG TPA: ABC transporter permease [Chloroflexi bacterium]|nr:ABC transporter permease [Chloroflexota bacterium]